MRGRQLESEHGRAPQLPRGRLSVAHDVQGWLTHRSGPRCQLRSRPHAVPPGKFLLSLVSLESTQRPAHWRVKALSVVGLNGKSLSVGPRQGGGGGWFRLEPPRKSCSASNRVRKSGRSSECAWQERAPASVPGLVRSLRPTCSRFRPCPERSIPGSGGLGGRREILGPAANSFCGLGP